MGSVGRPILVDPKVVNETIIKHKDSIVFHNKIASKNNAIWQQISMELGRKRTASSLYTYVCDNRNNIKDLLGLNKELSPPAITHNASIGSQTGDPNCSNTSKDGKLFDVIKFEFTMEKSEFMKFVITKFHRKGMKKGQPYKCLRPGLWEDMISSHIYEETKLRCGFLFKYHHLSYDLSKGSIKGHCFCNSDLFIRMEGSKKSITFHTTIQIGSKLCKKRPLRQPNRKKIGKQLQTVAGERLRADMAKELMAEGDPEPSFIPNLNVLRVVANEFGNSLHMDKDPIKALEILKCQSYSNIIHFIAQHPFFVFYDTSLQRTVYKVYSKEEDACLFIDATGGLVKKLIRFDGSRSQHIFLYLAVIRTKDAQISIAQMLSEIQDTGTIQYWINQWIKKGNPPPKETVTDCSRALVTALIRCFTGYLTIEDYADSYFNKVPKCYIRYDVAHFIKIYSSFLKNEVRLVRQFWLGVIGKLILCSDLQEAREIVFSAILVSSSETCGYGVQNELEITPAEKHKRILTEYITRKSSIDELLQSFENEHIDAERDEGSQENIENECNENIDDNFERNAELEPSKWAEWASKIDEEAFLKIKEGLQINAYYVKKFRAKLLKDLNHLPLFSCIYRDQYGFGRIPASSASVEGEINKIKNHILTKKKKSKTEKLRIDDFVKDHIDYLNGKMKLVDAQHNIRLVRNAHNISGNSHFDKSGEDYNANNDLNKNSQSGKKCRACQSNDLPTQHHCAMCLKPVHIIDDCSFPLIAEKTQLCFDCYHSKSGEQIVAVNEIEDWRGLGTSEKNRKKDSKEVNKSKNKDEKETKQEKTKNRKALYLKNEADLSTAMKFKHLKIPIIKNGSSSELSSVKISSKYYTFQWTCALDSLIQVMVYNLSHNNYLREAVKNLKSKFFELVEYMLTNEVNSHIYRLRALLYLDVFKSNTEADKHRYKTQKKNCVLVNCDCTIRYLMSLLLQSFPSYTESSICQNGCSIRTKNIIFITAKSEDILNVKFGDIITNYSIVDPQSCRRPLQKMTECNGNCITRFDKAGVFIYIEVIEENLEIVETPKFRLRQIPKVVDFREETYKLAGIINYIKPITTSTENDIGHYTAICPSSNLWIEFDDFKTTIANTNRNGNFQVNPAILIYCKNSIP